MPSFTALLLVTAASSVSAAAINNRGAATAAVPAPICDLPGLGASPSSAGNYYRYLGDTNMAACQELCHGDEKCRSFSSFKPGGSGNCYLYGAAADQVKRTAAAGYAVFDADCSLGSSSSECLMPGYGGASAGENGFLEESHNVTASDCRARCWSVSNCAAFAAASSANYAPSSCFLYSTKADSMQRYEREAYAVSSRDCQDPAPVPSCNKPGLGSLSGSDFGYYSSISNMSLVDCQTECDKGTSCRAFSGVTGVGAKGDCYLYKATADKVYRTTYNGYGVFDRRCSLE